MNENGLMVYDFDSISNYLVEKGVCTAEEALTYLEAEDAYYDSVGLNDYGEAGEPTEPSTAPVIDQNDVDAYIVEHTNLELSKVQDISDQLMEYLVGQGIAIDPEDM